MQSVCIYLCAAAVVYNLLLDIYRLEEKTLRYGILTTVSTLINIVFSLLLVIGFKQDWLGRIEANLISSTLFLLWGCINLFSKGYLKCVLPTKEIYKETLLFGIPLVPHSINGFYVKEWTVILLIVFFSTKSVGLFSFAINFSLIIYSVGSAFNKSNSVYIYKCLSEGNLSIRNRLRKQTFLLLIFYAGFTSILYFACRLLIPILFPNLSGCSCLSVSSLSEYFFSMCVFTILQFFILL